MEDKLEMLLSELPKVKTCEYSCLPEGRMWCKIRDKTTIGYCESCPLYKIRS